MTTQIFIQSPDLKIPTLSLTITQNSTPLINQLPIPKSLIPSLYFTLNGKPLSDFSHPIIPNFSTLILHIKTLGGGGDGGSTCAESRDCYLNMYAVKKPDKVDPNEARLSRWTNCALSFEPLKPPCVVDKLGNLFNKEVLVHALLSKKLPKEFGYIKGLKDMITLSLDESGSGSGFFQCPVSGLEFNNGKYKFYVLRTCGHVLSGKALKEVKSSGCLVCRKEFSEEDKIVINGNVEEVAVLREKMEVEKSNKVKEKKGKRHCVDGGSLVGGKVEVKEGSVKKKLKTGGGLVAPVNATKEVYASIFTSSRKSEFKETYSCRSLPLGRN